MHDFLAIVSGPLHDRFEDFSAKIHVFVPADPVYLAEVFARALRFQLGHSEGALGPADNHGNKRVPRGTLECRENGNRREFVIWELNPNFRTH